MVFPGKNPSEDREMQHGIRETVQMAPGRVGPSSRKPPCRGRPAPAADHVVPEPDSGVAAPPQVPDHADRPTDPDMAYVAAVAAANLAVEGVEDVTRYGLTIPFTRWLFAYKAGLAAEDFAISTKEDLELAERARGRNDFAAPGVPTDGNRDSTPARHTPRTKTPSDDTGKDEAEDAVPDAQGNEGETDATPEPKNGADGEPTGEDVLSIPESKGDRRRPGRTRGADRPVRRANPDAGHVLFEPRKLRWSCTWRTWPLPAGRDDEVPVGAGLVAVPAAHLPARRVVARLRERPTPAGPDDDLQHPSVRPARPGVQQGHRPRGPLGIDENEHTTGPGEPLPCERPPKGWRRKAMEPPAPGAPEGDGGGSGDHPRQGTPAAPAEHKTARDR